MLGAIAGDIIGSVYEGAGLKSEDFPLFRQDSCFTDDSVLTAAVADAILKDGDYASALRTFGRRHPRAGYGGSFAGWLSSPHQRPYRSWGNGAAMRVSPVGFAFGSPEEVLREARRTAEVTHDHPEGIKGAQATALAVFLGRAGASKTELREEIAGRFGYDIDRRLDHIRPGYRFDISCQGSVPESLIAFLESADYEDALRKAVSLGGDADTMACIAGAVAEAFYGGVPEPVAAEARRRLTADLLEVVERFQARFGLAPGP